MMLPCMRCTAVLLGFLLVLTTSLNVPEREKFLPKLTRDNMILEESSARDDAHEQQLNNTEDDVTRTVARPDEAVSSCDEWGEFGPRFALTSSQVIHPWTRIAPHDFNGFWHGPNGSHLDVGLMVNPEHKFAFCMLPGVDSSLWSLVLSEMSSKSTRTDLRANKISDSFSPEQAMTVFSQPDSSRVVFVSDPLSRFVMTLLQLCFGMKYGTCPMEPTIRRADLTMKHAVEWALTTDLTSLDDWAPQSSFCELRTRINEYTFIGLALRDSFLMDSSCILESSGLGHYNLWNNPAVRPFDRFQENQLSIDENVLQYLFTVEAAKSLIDVYLTDYNTFHFPMTPAWFDRKGSGKFYDVPLVKFL